MTKLKSIKDTSSFPKAILIIFVMQFILFLAFYSKNPEDVELLYITGLISIVGVFIFIAKVVLIIDEEKVIFYLFPLARNKVKWNDIDKIEIIQISAFSDFLGMGLRSSTKYGKGYITDTSDALFITKKNGQKITISIKEKEKIISYLQKIDKL